MTYSLREYQTESILAVGTKHACGLNRLVIHLPTGMGKGHPLNTPVPTPDGLRLWGDLETGDQVFGSDGQPTTVTAIYDRGVLPAFTVTFKHGESVVVDADHLWTVQRKGRKPRTVSTQWLMSQPLKDGDGYLWAIPVAGAVQRPATDLPLDPYVVGCLIANGGMTQTGTNLTTPDDQVIERVRQSVTANRIDDITPGACPRYSLPGLTRITRDLGMRVPSGQKRIPRTYLEASVPQRIALLQGLMVSDGSVRNGGRRSITYFTTSSGLADDVKELVTSLSGTCSIRAYRDDTEYVLNVLLPQDVTGFDTDRKVPDSEPRRKFMPRNAIVSIEPAGEVPIRCISVSAPDHLYLITTSHIVTHNTVIMCFLAAATPGKIVFIMHREELIDQTIEKLKEICPTRSIGKVKAETKETDAELVVCSIQTLARSPLTVAALGTPAMIQVDECHHSACKTYVSALRTLGAFDGVLTVGFTATLTRNDELGLGDVWQSVAYRQTVEWGERKGYILPTRDVQIAVPSLDLSEVRQTTDEWGETDYNLEDLGKALINANAGKVLAAEYKRVAGKRRGVVFCPTKKAAQVIAADFIAAGIATGVITGDTEREDRQAMYADMRAGRLQVLVNCMVLTEGFDMPEIECVVIARPTKSQSLFIQMRGRGTRPCPEIGKRYCLLLDTVGVTEDHGKNVKPNLKRTGPPVKRVKGFTPGVKAPAAKPAKYHAKVTGRLVVVTRDGTLIARKTARDAQSAPDLARLLIRADQLKQTTSR